MKSTRRIRAAARDVSRRFTFQYPNVSRNNNWPKWCNGLWYTVSKVRKRYRREKCPTIRAKRRVLSFESWGVHVWFLLTHGGDIFWVCWFSCHTKKKKSIGRCTYLMLLLLSILIYYHNVLCKRKKIMRYCTQMLLGIDHRLWDKR